MAPTDQATLELLAEQLLAKLNTDSTGTPIKFPISIAKFWLSGDSVPLHITKLGMDSIYRVQKILKGGDVATVTFEASTALYRNILKELKESTLEQLALRTGAAWTRNTDTTPSSSLLGDMWTKTDGSLWWYDGASWQQVQNVV